MQRLRDGPVGRFRSHSTALYVAAWVGLGQSNLSANYAIDAASMFQSDNSTDLLTCICLWHRAKPLRRQCRARATIIGDFQP